MATTVELSLEVQLNVAAGEIADGSPVGNRRHVDVGYQLYSLALEVIGSGSYRLVAQPCEAVEVLYKMFCESLSYLTPSTIVSAFRGTSFSPPHFSSFVTVNTVGLVRRSP